MSVDQYEKAWARDYAEVFKIVRQTVNCSEERMRELMFADWPNWDEHIEWLIAAPSSEIANWFVDGSR